MHLPIYPCPIVTVGHVPCSVIGATTEGCSYKGDSCTQSTLNQSVTKYVGIGRQDNSLLLAHCTLYTFMQFSFLFFKPKFTDKWIVVVVLKTRRWIGFETWLTLGRVEGRWLAPVETPPSRVREPRRFHFNRFLFRTLSCHTSALIITT